MERVLRLEPRRALALLVLLSLTACSSSEGWTEPQQVSPYVSLFSPLVVGGESGVLAVWREDDFDPPDGSDRRVGVAASWYRNGWGDVVIVDDYASYPVPFHADVNDDGDAIVGWAVDESPDRSTLRTGFFARRYRDGDGWLDPERVGERNFDPRTGPRVALGPEGRAFAVWVARDPTSRGDALYVAEYLPDTGWGEPVGYDTGSSFGRVEILGIGSDESGGMAVVWLGENWIEGNHYSREEGWQEPSSPEAPIPGGIPEITFDRKGTGWAYWTSRASEDACPGAARYTESGWEEAVFLQPDCEPGVGGGAFSVDDLGNAVAVWSEGFDSEASSSWSRYVDGSGWTPAEPIPGPGGPETWGVTALPGGRAAAISYRGTGLLDLSNEVWTTQLDPSTGWEEPTLVTTRGPTPSVNSLAGPPSVVRYRSDRALGVFLEREGEEIGRLSSTFWSMEFR